MTNAPLKTLVTPFAVTAMFFGPEIAVVAIVIGIPALVGASDAMLPPNIGGPKVIPDPEAENESPGPRLVPPTVSVPLLPSAMCVA